MVTSTPSHSGYRPLPGPVDRVSFLAEQSRNRRASWLLAAFAVAAVMLTSIPFGVIAAPLFYLGVMPLALVMTMLYPHSGWVVLILLPGMLLPMLFGFGTHTSQVTFANAGAVHAIHGVLPAVIGTLLFAVLPGALVFVAVWLVVRRVLARAGAGAILRTLGARDPDPKDDEERQLVDVVGEIAVAAGITSPRVAIVDAESAGGVANAAAVGWSIEGATVVVTRPLLDTLTRDQIQGVIARVIASIGNGDLRTVFRMLSVFQTARVIQYAMFGVSRRSTLRLLRRCVGLAARRHSVGSDAERSSDETVAADLLDISSYRVPIQVALEPHFSALGCLFAPVLFPLRFAAWTIGFIMGASESLVTGPLVDATWRQRELLADATAVKLTRNPDGLAGALERFRDIGEVMPKAEVVSYLFAAWWPAASGPGGTRPTTILFARKPHATPERRIAQLVAMGAQREAEGRPDVTPVEGFASSPSVLVLDSSPFRALTNAIVAMMFVYIVWVMMWTTMLLTSGELFALAFGGLWLVQRLHIGPTG